MKKGYPQFLNILIDFYEFFYGKCLNENCLKEVNQNMKWWNMKVQFLSNYEEISTNIFYRRLTYFHSHNTHNIIFSLSYRAQFSSITRTSILHKFSSPQIYAIRRQGLLTACINNFQIHPRIRLTRFTKCFLICGYIALEMMTKKNRHWGWYQLKSFN